MFKVLFSIVFLFAAIVADAQHGHPEPMDILDNGMSPPVHSEEPESLPESTVSGSSGVKEQEYNFTPATGLEYTPSVHMEEYLGIDSVTVVPATPSNSSTGVRRPQEFTNRAQEMGARGGTIKADTLQSLPGRRDTIRNSRK
jgi:hypothetical protein